MRLQNLFVSTLLIFCIAFHARAQSIEREPSLVEKLKCLDETGADEHKKILGMDPLVEAGFFPNDAKNISYWTDAYEKSPNGEQALQQMVQINESVAGRVSVTKKEADPNADPNSTSARANWEISYDGGRNYSGAEGQKRFEEDLKTSCENMSQALTIDITEDCMKRKDSMDESIKKLIAENTDFHERLKNAPPEKWGDIIKEEQDQIAKKLGPSGNSCFANAELRDEILLTKRDNVMNTLLCFGGSPFVPISNIHGKSACSGDRAIGRSLTFAVGEESKTYAAVYVVHNGTALYVLNPAWLYTIAGIEPDDFHRRIAASSHYGPGPIEFRDRC